MKEPHWITKEIALAMHARQLSEHGGLDGVRDETLLDSRLHRAQNLFLYGENDIDMPALAASYAYGIATNHPFLDGNKRTAHVVMRTFLILNGYDLIAPQLNKYEKIMALAAGTLSEDDLAVWLRTNTTAHKTKA